MKNSREGIDGWAKWKDNCRCFNYLKEVSYTVQLRAGQEGAGTNAEDPENAWFYRIQNIYADVVVVEEPIKAKCDANVAVNQQFKIDFVVCDPEVADSCDTSQIQKMSGSPGYIDGYPLKIAFTEQPLPRCTKKQYEDYIKAIRKPSAVLTSFKEGFEILGTNRVDDKAKTYVKRRGDCSINQLEGPGHNIDYGDPILRFK